MHELWIGPICSYRRELMHCVFGRPISTKSRPVVVPELPDRNVLCDERVVDRNHMSRRNVLCKCWNDIGIRRMRSGIVFGNWGYSVHGMLRGYVCLVDASITLPVLPCWLLLWFEWSFVGECGLFARVLLSCFGLGL